MPISSGLRHAVLRFLLVALCAGIFVGPAQAAKRRDAWPLHPGSKGQRVADLQFLLGGHGPYVFSQVKPTFKGKPNASFGARTKSADLAMKWRIGYPRAGQCGAKGDMLVASTGPKFFAILEGKQTRPACWVALAAARLKAINTGPTQLALQIRSYEVHLVTLGIRESPDGSNRGPAISRAAYGVPALQSATGAYGAAWCVSTQQTVLKTIGYGTFADDTAGVYYAVDWAAKRSLLSAKPKIGALVAFIDYDSAGHRIAGTGHLGFVSAVQASSFSYIAGNDGNGVREHTIPDGSRSYAFIYLPRLAT